MKTICLTDHYWDERVKGPSKWYAPQDTAHVREALPLPEAEDVRLLLGCSLIYSCTLWGAVMLFPSAFAGMFTADAALLPFTSRALRIYCAVLCIFGIQTACQMTFLALGRAMESILVAVFRKIILLLPLIYLVPLFTADKAFGVYLAEPICDLLAVAFTAITFRYHFKKAMQKLEICLKTTQNNKL